MSVSFVTAVLREKKGEKEEIGDSGHIKGKIKCAVQTLACFLARVRRALG